MTTTMRRGACIVIAAVVLLLSAGPVFGGSQTQQYCDPSTDVTRVQLRENVLGDGSDGNDTLMMCFDEENLSAIGHTPAGNCHASGIGALTWNDCVDSYRVWLPANRKLCFFKDYLFHTFMESIKGPQDGTWHNLAEHDALTGILFRNTTDSCFING